LKAAAAGARMASGLLSFSLTIEFSRWRFEVRVSDLKVGLTGLWVRGIIRYRLRVVSAR